MPRFARWYPATACTGSARPGAKALMRHVLDSFARAANWGIYNCRTVRGGATTSPHGEGRAVDVGFPTAPDGRGSRHGHALVDAILAAGPRKLGVQAIIYDRTIWSARSPNGRRYNGAHPHYDHVHVEITRSAAEKMTLATVRSVLGGGSPEFEDYRDDVRPGERTIAQWDDRPNSAGDDVKFVQSFIGEPKAGPADGYFGPKTEAGVRWYQDMRGITVDGIVGPQTWGEMGR